MEWLPGALERLSGVEPYEVAQALNSPGRRHAVPVERHGARLLLIFGRSREGRLVVVLIRPRAGFDSLIVAARAATAAETEAHRAWEEGQS